MPKQPYEKYTTWPKTLQEAFDRVWRRFVIEKASQAADSDGEAVYVLPDDHDCRCAIGLQIPFGSDEEKFLLERPKACNTLVLDSLQMKLDLLVHLEPLADRPTWRELQHTHDHAVKAGRDPDELDKKWFHKNIEIALRRFAAYNKLEALDAEVKDEVQADG